MRNSLRKMFHVVRRAMPQKFLMKQFYSQFIQKGDLVFDVGANRGDFCEVFLELGARVVAFEPQPSCVERLKERFRGVSTFELVAKAVSDKTGSVVLHLFSSDALASCSNEWIERTKTSGRFGNAVVEKSVSVESITLDAAVAQYGVPKFCKIDVEGFEINVLRGLFNPIPIISFEFASENLDRASDCLEYLRGRGWNPEAAISFGDQMRLAAPGWQPPEELLSRLSQVKELNWGDIFVRTS